MQTTKGYPFVMLRLLLCMDPTNVCFDENQRQMPYVFLAAKKSNGLWRTLCHLFDLPITMFRFFTVYGPWGRLTCLFKFIKAMTAKEEIEIYNHGKISVILLM